MLLEATTKSRNGSQEDQHLEGLESSLDKLSVSDTKTDLSELESAISKVSLKESSDHHSEDEESEGKNNQETSTAEVADATAEDNKAGSVSDIRSDSEDNEDLLLSKEKDHTDDEAETEKKEKDDKDEEKSLLDEKQSLDKLDEVQDGKADAEEKKERKEKSDKTREVKEASLNAVKEKKSSSEGLAEKAVPSGKKLLTRGLGAGTSDQQYPYMPQTYNPDYSYIADTAGMLTVPVSQMTMSPQYAMSPTYMGVAMSPLPAFSDSIQYDSSLGSPISMCNADGMTNLGYPQHTMMPESPVPTPNSLCNADGMTNLGFPQHTLMPESPVPTPDARDFYQLSPPMSEPRSPQSQQPFSLDDILEAFKKVDNCPYTPVPDDKLDSIKRELLQTLESGVTPQMSDFSQCLDAVLFEKATKKLANVSNEALTMKDEEGDTPCMVIACQKEGSVRYKENLYAMVNRVKTIRICCENPIDNKNPMKVCTICGNADENKFYSPLAMYNYEGDTLLSSILKLGHSPQVVNFICETICQNPSDFKIVFSHERAEVYLPFKSDYPVLSGLVPDY